MYACCYRPLSRGGSSISTFGRGGNGGRVSEGPPVTEKNVNYMLKYTVFDIKQHIITKFSSQCPVILTKISFGSKWGKTSDWGCPCPLLPVPVPLRTVPAYIYTYFSQTYIFLPLVLFIHSVGQSTAIILQLHRVPVTHTDFDGGKANATTKLSVNSRALKAVHSTQHCTSVWFLARDVILYISRLCYDLSVRLSVRLSLTEVHWRIIANLGFKFRSQFTANCGRDACGREGKDHNQEEWRDHDHLALC